MDNLRKMGFLEKGAVLLHDEMAGSSAIVAVLKVGLRIDFSLFKAAWQALFNKHPLLRATYQQINKDCYFKLNANFSNIPIREVCSDNSSVLDAEYSCHIIKPFSTECYGWRATLIKLSTEKSSYCIFAAPHTICDGKSVTHLLGDFLRCIIALDKGLSFDTASYPLPPPIDQLLPKDKLSTTIQHTLPTEMLSYSVVIKKGEASAGNILRTIDEITLNKILNACRVHDVSLTNAVAAALVMANIALDSDQREYFYFSLGIDLRQFLKNYADASKLVNYSSGLSLKIKREQNLDFWWVAKQVNQDTKKAIQNVKLNSGNNDVFFENATKLYRNWVEQKKIPWPTLLSNIGVIDAIFPCEDEYPVQDLYLIMSNQLMYEGVVACVTVKNKLNITFNFPLSVVNKEAAILKVDKIIAFLLFNTT